MAALRLFLDPAQAIEQQRTILGLLGIRGADPFIQELRHADGGGAGRGIVRGNDDIAQGARGAALRLGERERPHVAGLVDFHHAGIEAVAFGGDGRSGVIGGEQSGIARDDGGGSCSLN